MERSLAYVIGNAPGDWGVGIALDWSRELGAKPSNEG